MMKSREGIDSRVFNSAQLSEAHSRNKETARLGYKLNIYITVQCLC